MTKFNVWHPSGVLVEITDDDTETEWLAVEAAWRTVEAALTRGFLVERPVAGEGEKTEHVIGFTVGKYKDRGGSLQPCVWMWPAPPRKYSIATVYPEQFGLLPFPVPSAEWPASHLDSEMARIENVFHKWETDVILAPKMEGEEVKRTETGNVVYRFVGVKGYQPAAQQSDSEHARLVNEFDQLGIRTYDVKWPEVRQYNAGRISNGQKANTEDLTDEELRKLIKGLQTLVNKGK